jgi:protein-S-isoprenylcysteine O-methyltransferase Ste14
MPTWQLVLRSSLVQVAFLFLPFLAAGTLHWLRGWSWFALQFLTLSVSVALTQAKNPGLLKARIEHSRPIESFDKAFSRYFVLSTAALLIVAGLGARWGWPRLSWSWFYAGAALQIIGLIPIVAASCINPFLEGIVRIQDDRGHTVVTSGVYSVVRHPMYTGLMLERLAWPLTLGSPWAAIPAVLAALAFCFRALNEERVLRDGLPGYPDYMRRTPYRLIPGLW